MSDMDVIVKVTHYLECLEAEIKEVLGREVNDSDNMAVVSDRDEDNQRCGLIWLTYAELDTLRALSLQAVNAKKMLGMASE